MTAQEHPLRVTEPALLIRINQKYSPALSSEALYEVTRGVWVIGNRRETVSFAIAVADGVVREVYAIHSWHPAGTTAYKTRSQEDVNLAGRWEFVGAVAPPAVREKYLGQSVAHYFLRGAANPITYVP